MFGYTDQKLFSFRALIDVPRFLNFIWVSLTMKIILVLGIVFMIGAQGIGNLLGEQAKVILNAGTLMIGLYTLAIIYHYYIMALVVGERRFFFIKIFAVELISVVFAVLLKLMGILSESAFIPMVVVGILGWIVGFGMTYSNQVSFRDIIFGWISNFLLSILMSLIIFGTTVSTLLLGYL